jgi:hypothetical protein
MFKTSFATTLVRRVCAAFDFVISIAPRKEICVLVFEIQSIFVENDCEL